MHDATSRPKRMRYSYETRCRAVDAMLGGMSPGRGRQQRGRQSRHGLPLAQALPHGRLGRAARTPLDTQAPAAPADACRGG